MTRKFRPQKSDLSVSENSQADMLDQPVAVYYRQSTVAQVGNVSTTIQTVDMVEELIRRGWQRDQIYLIDDDEGVSGTKRIDEREGMSHLFELIAEKRIGAVACQDEDRLFRDMTQIQVNIFIDTCRKSNVKVITPYIIYDFAHPLHGEFHARQFRFKCDMAAEYLKIYIMGRLTPARQRIMKEGKWSGSKMPVGFMVDMRKRLPDGTENPEYRKYVPFEPFAQIVREYFRIFLENGGAIRKTLRQIRQEHISFPDCQPPEGFRIRYQLTYKNGECYIAATCFRLLITNPAYIGHWHFKGVIIHWNNHQPLIDPDTFMRAFNYISKYTLTGENNPDYQNADKYARPKLQAERNVERPLLGGMIYSKVGERWYYNGVQFEKRNHCYLYALYRVEYDGTYMEWARRAEWIDKAVVTRFKQKLQATFNLDTWTQAIQESEQLVERDRKIKKIQLSSLLEEMQNVVASIGKLTHPFLIQEVEERYRQMEQERDRLNAEIAALEQQRHNYLSTEQAYAVFEQTLTGWNTMSQEERRNVLTLFIERIVASEYSRAGDMNLTIFWRDGSSDEIQIWHKSHAAHWDIENSERLLALFDSGADQLQLAAAFPDLRWHQIFNEIKKHRGLVRFSPSRLGKNETYKDYAASGGRKGKHTCSKWQPYEDEQLRQMVKAKVVQLEIMKVFPFRRWIQIQYRIKVLLGKGIRVPMSGVGQHISYDEYEAQTKTQDTDASSQ